MPKTWKHRKGWYEQKTVELLMWYSLRWVSCVGLEGIRVERWVEVICRRYSYVIIRCEDFFVPFIFFLSQGNVFTLSIGNPYPSSNHIAFMTKALEGGD